MFPTSAFEMILSIVLSNLLWIPNVKPKPKSLMSSINSFNSVNSITHVDSMNSVNSINSVIPIQSVKSYPN